MPVITADNLSKLYHLGERSSTSLRDAISGFFRTDGALKTELWALKDVSFDVQQGDTLGIIGRNGAGKSTLLKILSRITKPTRGTAEIRGRVGSLLEVGTGFHNELSGRENIYLNGAILGMKRAEIERRFDEIVAFSEIEQFLDTPVKHYSSGMYMRLAFSVAAHLEPDVLIVDEVLAVGDTSFQNKCLGKMDEVSRSGRTVLFVSHNLGSLAQICNKGLLLHKGQMVSHGDIRETVNDYLKLSGQENQFALQNPDTSADMQITEVAVTDAAGRITNEIAHNEEFYVSIRFTVRRVKLHTQFCIALLNKYKRRVFTSHKDIEQLIEGRPGEYRATFRVPGDFVAPNNYSFLVQIFCTDGEMIQEVFDICPFDVIDAGTELAAYKDYGYVLVKDEWQLCRD